MTGECDRVIRRVAVAASLALLGLYGAAWLYAETAGAGAGAEGHDLVARLLDGNRAVFRVSCLAAVIVIPPGVALGVAAGARDGWLRRAVLWLCDVLSAVPGLLLVVTVALLAGRGMAGAVSAIALAAWARVCRDTYAAILHERERPYVLAAAGVGLQPGRILFGHIVPAALPAMATAVLLFFSFAVSSEVILGFLGLGVDGGASWGALLREARVPLWQGAWRDMTYAGLALVFLLLPLNVLAAALAPGAGSPAAGPGENA